ncbi:MAG TPA: hypothetical protein PLV09_02990, partial [Candidatus Omnitrophota bacterium]|nr:hypothetical protein [Candidatus Omnitrophota bacterium]
YATPSAHTHIGDAILHYRKPRGSWLLDYGFALVVSLAFLGLRMYLGTAIADRPLMILLMSPIILSAVVGGVGPGIAATLDIPQVTYVKKTEEIKEGSARFERMTEEGYEVIETPLPCLITVVKEINIPRLPSLKGKIKAKQSKATVICANDIDADPERLGLKGSPTVVNKIFSPPKRTGGQILQGEVPEMAGKLADSIKDVVISVSKT